jgi:hypothetical protein
MTTHTIKIRRLFNGSPAGCETTHEVTSTRGLARVLPRGHKDGWGCDVIIHSTSLEKLGGYVNAAGQGVLLSPSGYITCTVIP